MWENETDIFQLLVYWHFDGIADANCTYSTFETWVSVFLKNATASPISV